MPLMPVYEPRPVPPPRLTGCIKTRAAARLVYADIVSELQLCADKDTLEIYLITIGEPLLQFQTELDFLWEGDSEDFKGLNREIQAAFARFATFY